MNGFTKAQTFFDRASRAPVDFVTVLLDHVTTIRMVILRNLKTKYRGNPLGLLFEFLQPLVISTIHYFYFSIRGRDVPSNQYLVFVVGGFTIWFCFTAAYDGSYRACGRPGSVTKIPGVNMMHVCIAKCLWPFMTFFIFAMLIAYPWEMLGFELRPPDFVLSVENYGMAAGLGFGFGMFAHSLVETVPSIYTIVKLFRWALFVTSGIYSSLSTMSTVELLVCQWNPLVHLTEYERYAFYSGYPIFYASQTYPALMMVLLTFAGLTWNRYLNIKHAGSGADD